LGLALSYFGVAIGHLSMNVTHSPVELLDPQKDADRQTASLAGMAVALALVVAGLFLVHQLYLKTQVEDCLLSGRLNCASLIASTR
jgi:hypothetical protein